MYYNCKEMSSEKKKERKTANIGGIKSIACILVREKRGGGG